jgi:alpha-beta hydrolase superfamily lysophospholipase
MQSAAPATQHVEEEVALTAPDGKRIYVTIGHPIGSAKGTVILVHGLASTALWPTILLGSWYFRRKGYAYCRINLYDWRSGARSLMTSDLRQHSRDVDTVIRYLTRRGFSNFYGVGHSFGGLTLLRTNTAVFSAVSLWDCSSFISYPPRQWLRKDRDSGATYLIGGCELLMSKRFIRSMVSFPDELELISQVNAPCQICYAAGKSGALIESSKRYYSRLTVEGELVPVANASHSFTEEGVAEILFARCEKWFRRHTALTPRRSRRKHSKPTQSTKHR